MRLIPHLQDDTHGRPEYRSPDGTWRGVQEDQRVSPALEGGVAMPGSVGLGALVDLPAGPKPADGSKPCRPTAAERPWRKSR